MPSGTRAPFCDYPGSTFAAAEGEEDRERGWDVEVVRAIHWQNLQTRPRGGVRPGRCLAAPLRRIRFGFGLGCPVEAATALLRARRFWRCRATSPPRVLSIRLRRSSLGSLPRVSLLPAGALFGSAPAVCILWLVQFCHSVAPAKCCHIVSGLAGFGPSRSGGDPTCAAAGLRRIRVFIGLYAAGHVPVSRNRASAVQQQRGLDTLVARGVEL